MMRILTILFLVLLPYLLIGQTLTQQTLSAGAFLGDGSLVFTVGQIAGGTNAQGEFIWTEGFHQPSQLITAIHALDEEDPVVAYPNPFSKAFQLQIPDEFEWIAEVFDISGKRIKQLGSVSSNTSIRVGDWPSTALYIRVVRTRDGHSQVLKLQKID